uniref:NADH-ubiquinone oxidoreductase chain 6 n=1 Tax=Paraglypturus tonganus (nomen nudum) TaxID=1519029 RepID=A0A0U1WND0_9EUCA|nr:NADH dehydrogenase subunit 6 [Paraglypturus tonganus (nomen nudum)]AIG22703.1 NADH dehydrogenase subunit 6 [Paraglypturus tonganus (nomen nudum)]
MLLLFTPLFIFLNLLFMRLFHPLSMGLALLLQTCLVCVSSGLMALSFWFSYVLFLVFLGGMLVLFIYVASLASNESFKLSMTGLVFFVISALCMLLFFMLDMMGVSVKFFIESSDFSGVYSNMDLVSLIYGKSVMIFTLYVVLYLLLTLFAVVEITGSYFGPLRVSV